MTIRHKITLWITAVGVLTSLVFSLVVFFEMAEQPYRIIDSDLTETAKTIGQLISDQQRDLPASPDVLSFVSGLYWLKVYDRNQKVIYESKLSRLFAVPFHDTKKGYTVSIPIPPKGGAYYRNDDELMMRVKVVRHLGPGIPYTILIGKPIEHLEEEVSELMIGIGVALGISLFMLVLISYGVAGRILKPIGEINRLARKINEKTLDRRIPTGESADELHELSTTLNQMFDRLQYSFNRQKQFLADASHELKTPITLLRLFNEDAVNREDLPPAFRDRLVRQNDTIFRMDRLVKNLLELSALELKDTLDIKVFSLTGLVRSVLDEFDDLIAASEIHLRVDLPDAVMLTGDRDKICRALVNLMDNAVKYNHPGGDITLSVAKESENVYITVTNTGPGIPPADLEKIFTQFYRMEKSRSHQYGGSGLGLTIVRRIVALHGGSIRMESDPGAWARAVIRLPKHCDGKSV